MIWSGKRAFLVMIGLSLALGGVAAEAEGGWLIRNPYVEGHRVINRPRLIGSTATAGHLHCDGCAATSCGEAYKKPKLTTAILCLRVSEDAVVLVNGQQTEKPRLAGENRNTRTFSFAGFERGETRDCLVKVGRAEYHYTLRAGQVTKGQITAADVSVAQEVLAQAETAATQAETAATQAETAATQAETAAIQATAAARRAEAAQNNLRRLKAEVERLRMRRPGPPPRAPGPPGRR